jgi:hypothetical protein
MSISKLFIPVVAAVSLLADGPVGAQPTSESGPILKPAKERGAPPSDPQPVVNESTTKQQRLSLCIDGWDAQTHMSKQEWRAACQRSVRDYPDAFVR